jgi:hypothetical protein
MKGEFEDSYLCRYTANAEVAPEKTEKIEVSLFSEPDEMNIYDTLNKAHHLYCQHAIWYRLALVLRSAKFWHFKLHKYLYTFIAAPFCLIIVTFLNYL